MTHSAPLPTPPRRTRRTVFIGLAVLGLAGALYVVRGPLMMSAPRCMAGRWHGCFDTFNGVVLMTLVAVPLSLLVVGALALRRRAAGVTSAWRMSLAEVGTVHGTVPFLWLTLMPGAAPGIAPARVSLVPLRDLATMGTLGIVGNLLVFASLGFFAPMRFAALASVPRILALGAGCSILVESAQYVFRLDRVSSVDDVLVNATGAALAALASRRWWRTTAGAPSDPPRLVSDVTLRVPATGRSRRR
ncbi:MULTISPECIES: VanZ family protein [unclassified Streptomyces]|uniref:VanZ family protein n=1 Tax=unclassified Streptomyces TaxID=2593676 RepID=UPI00165595DE|nr:VanZ family protein [Streptomyces sp. CB02980]MCB8904507.1 VanZ family protein [Streptomyces sp. CB02980]